MPTNTVTVIVEDAWFVHWWGCFFIYLMLYILLFLLFCDCFGAGTAERSLWSSRRTSVTSYWRRKAVDCLRRDIVSVTHREKRRPWRSTWTVVPWETPGRTEAQKVALWHIVWRATRHRDWMSSPKEVEQRLEVDALSLRAPGLAQAPAVHYSILYYKI